jgi:hypothetical protein
MKGFDPSKVPTDYGSKLHVYNWKEKTLRQSVELGEWLDDTTHLVNSALFHPPPTLAPPHPPPKKGPDGLIPLEVRFAHQPGANWGYVVSWGDDQAGGGKFTRVFTLEANRTPVNTPPHHHQGAALSSNVLRLVIKDDGALDHPVAVRQAWLKVRWAPWRRHWCFGATALLDRASCASPPTHTPRPPPTLFTSP